MTRGAGYLGVAVLAFLWLTPLDAWLGWAFPAHMLRHMGIVAIAAPLLAIGFGDRLAPFAPPVVIGAAAEFIVVWAWHLPAAHAFAYLSGAGFVLEQAVFLFVGLLVWVGAFQPGKALQGAGGLLLTSMHMTLLGALLILAPRDLYAAMCGWAPNLSAQQTGGLLMLAIGAPVYLVAGLLLVRRALDDDGLAEGAV